VCVQFNQTVNFVHQTSNKYIYICKKLQFIHIVNGDGSNQYKPAKMCNYWGPILEMEWSGGSNCVSVPNFEAIGPTVAEIWRYFDFSTWWPPPYLGFFKFQIFNGRIAQGGRTASPCQNWSKSVKTRPRYGNFSIFQDGGGRHLGFFKFQIFNDRTAQGAKLRRRAKFGLNRPKRGRDMAIFRFFKMASAAILNFSNF